MAAGAIRIGVIGAGGFGLFALQHFAQVEGIELAGMAGTHREAALAAAARFGIPNYGEVDALLARPEIDLVYIATPPFLHHPHAMQSLAAGKHVICEKPLALTLEQADEMIALAEREKRLLVVNLMQRYNPLFERVRRLIASGTLGEPLHGYFENYATDEQLAPEHWFWDRSKSGGIFIEHGVHFFDLFEGWLGPGRVVAAQRSRRPESGVEEQVSCTVRYGDGILVHHYHGFTQAARMDRQEIGLLLERGDLRLHEWIPVRARVHAVAGEANTRALMELFPGARLDTIEVYGAANRGARARHRELDLYQRFNLAWGEGEAKMVRYGELLRDMLRDQVQWIRDPAHVPKVTHENGRRSLAAAVEATRLADEEEKTWPGRSGAEPHRGSPATRGTAQSP